MTGIQVGTEALLTWGQGGQFYWFSKKSWKSSFLGEGVADKHWNLVGLQCCGSVLHIVYLFSFGFSSQIGENEMRACSVCLTLCDSVDCSAPRSSVHGILQARILAWAAMPSSRICKLNLKLFHWVGKGEIRIKALHRWFFKKENGLKLTSDQAKSKMKDNFSLILRQSYTCWQ